MALDPSLLKRVVVEARRLRAWSRALTEDTRRLRAAGTTARVVRPMPPDPWSSSSPVSYTHLTLPTILRV